jgi:hypothetical protein
VPQVWPRIVIARRISGIHTHDPHLAAIMQVNAVPSILTFNRTDFEQFPGIGIVDPVLL